MNVVMTGAGAFVEVQGTAEQTPFSKARLDELLALAGDGIARLIGAAAPRPRGAWRQDLHPLTGAWSWPRPTGPRAGRWPRSWPTAVSHPRPRRFPRRHPAARGRDVLYRERAGQGARGHRGHRAPGARRRLGHRGGRLRRPARRALRPLRRRGADRSRAQRPSCCGSSRACPPARRTARYRAVIAVTAPDGREAVTEGMVEGVLCTAPRGAGGFGYDPALLLPAARRHLRGDVGRGQARGQPSRTRDGAGAARPRRVAAARRVVAATSVPSPPQAPARRRPRTPVRRRPCSAPPIPCHHPGDRQPGLRSCSCRTPLAVWSPLGAGADRARCANRGRRRRSCSRRSAPRRR